MAFKTMDPAVTRELLKKHRDVLTPEIEAETQLFKNLRCPRCFLFGFATKRVDPPKIVMSEDGPEILASPFSPGRNITNGYAHCTNCGTDFCHVSGIIRHVEPFITSVQPEDLPPT